MMTRTNSPVEANLLYSGEGAPYDRIEEVALRALYGSPHADVTGIRKRAGEYILIDGPEFQIAIMCCDTPFSLDLFDNVEGLQGDDPNRADMLKKVSAHTHSLTVIVARSPTQVPDYTDQKTNLCREVVACLMATTQPDFVFWRATNRILTPSEAQLVCSAHFDSGGRTQRAAQRRLNRSDAGVRRSKIFDSDPVLSKDVLEWFHQPSETEAVVQATDVKGCTRNNPDYETRSETCCLADTSAGRASLYVMSATIMVMVYALPVGAMALTYNALSGGNLRATAHMMAVTGFGMALMAMGMPSSTNALEAIF